MCDYFPIFLCQPDVDPLDFRLLDVVLFDEFELRMVGSIRLYLIGFPLEENYVVIHGSGSVIDVNDIVICAKKTRIPNVQVAMFSV